LKYWLIRSDAPSVTVNHSASKLTIESRRAPAIRRGDQFVLLTAYETSVPIVGVVKDVQRSEPLGGAKPISTELSFEKAAVQRESSADLASLAYSLRLVKNLERPLLHFRRGYRTLSVADFDTLLKGEVFVSRTAYYQLLNALPHHTRRTYLTEQESQMARSTDSSFNGRLESLWEFVTERVLMAGVLLKMIDRDLSTLGLNQSYRHVFIDEGIGRKDFLDIQLASFVQLEKSLKTELRPQLGFSNSVQQATPDQRSSLEPLQDVVKSALGEVSSDELGPTQRRFESIFRDVR
jgi:hypothetical protein